jgi:pilus assembly protein CpaC
MIAGIIQSKALERLNKLPGIGSVPIIGDLIRSESFTRNESELVVMITAYTVEPFAEPNAVDVIDAENRPEPLNRALAEALTVAYGETVRTYAEGRPFGYIVE